MIPPVIYLYPFNTQVIQIFGLQDALTMAYLNAATVTATLFDKYGTPDSILTGISLTYVAMSNGNYQGFVPATFNATVQGAYVLQITATQSGVQSVFSIPTVVSLRETQ